MDWLKISLPALGIVTAGALAGWYFGRTLEFALVSLLGVVLYGCYRMSLVQQWLRTPELAPPDLRGAWGELVARIFQQRAELVDQHEQLLAQRDYLLESISSMRDGVVIIGRHGEIRWCNEAASRLLALDYPRVAGEAITSLVGNPDFVEYVNTGDYNDPLLFNTGGAPDFYLQVVITRFEEGDCLIFVRNVSGRTHGEQVRRDFVGNVSHELRTPLTVISGYLATFLSDTSELPPRLVKPLEQMSQQADRMENLLADLLWLSRIESDEREEKRESVDVARLLEELRDELASMYPGRRLITRVSTQVKISGDYRELYSAASNLVQNALKYSAEDTPVTVSWRVGIGGYHLSVSDLGRGIEEAHIPRLTERFYRVDDSRSSATGGTGLGLAIVKHVAASHDAQLLIESEVGRGSTFSLVFPYKSRPAGELA